MKKDYLVRATAGDSQIRAFAITSRCVVETARQAHGTSPVITAALGRLLSAGLMMGAMMKNEEDIVTIKISGDGPVEGLVVTANTHGQVKGYAYNPIVNLPPNEKGKLDVATAVGIGVLQVIKDIGMKEPYVGDTILITSEIAEDLTYYFANSEQTPSSVGLGVLMNKDNTVAEAGGFIIQLMPGASDEMITMLEERLASITSITEMLSKGMNPEAILEYIFEGMSPIIHEKKEVEFSCNCSKERVAKAIISLGREEISQMIEEGNSIEVNCHFCNEHYHYSVDELKELYSYAIRS